MFRPAGLFLSLLSVLFLLFPPSPSECAPKNIVSLSPVGTEILFALGQGDNVRYVTEFCDYPHEALDKPKLGGFSGMNFEKLAESGADLAVISDIHLQYTDGLDKLGIAYCVVRQGSVAEICDSITALGKICEAEAEAKQITETMKNEISRISEKAAKLSKRRVLLCVSRELSEPRISVFYAAGGKTFYDELITLAGGENVLKDFEAAYPRVSAEGLVALDPEAIIDLVGDSAYYHSPGNIDKETVFSEERLMGQWKSGPQVEAVRDGRVSILRGTVYLRPGPRITEILRAFAEAIHPEEQW